MSSINSIDSVYGHTTEVETNENENGEVTFHLPSQNSGSSSDSGTTASSTKKVKGKYEKKNTPFSNYESDSESEGEIRVPKEGEIIPQFVLNSQLHLVAPDELPHLGDEQKEELRRRKRAFDHRLFNSPRRNPILLAKELKLSTLDQQEIALAHYKKIHEEQLKLEQQRLNRRELLVQRRNAEREEKEDSEAVDDLMFLLNCNTDFVQESLDWTTKEDEAKLASSVNFFSDVEQENDTCFQQRE